MSRCLYLLMVVWAVLQALWPASVVLIFVASVLSMLEMQVTFDVIDGIIRNQ
jgi:hypothetical protein